MIRQFAFGTGSPGRVSGKTLCKVETVVSHNLHIVRLFN